MQYFYTPTMQMQPIYATSIISAALLLEQTRTQSLVSLLLSQIEAESLL